MPFTLHTSPEFVKQLKACEAYRHQTGDTSEFLIYRFDGDASNMGCIFSMDHTTPVRSSGAGSIYPALKGRAKNDKITKPHPHQGGGHAEEIFMRSLDKFTAYGNVRTVEMFISMIPCDRSAACQMDIEGTKVMAPSGCGDKLKMLARCFDAIQWEICFEREYTGDTQRRTRQHMSQLDSMLNARVYRYNAGVVNRFSV